MFPTAARLSKASRRPLTPKRGNKDFYKGTRQAALPGGHRTGAPGRFIVRGSGKYRLLDEKVRVFVAPHVTDINQCELKPYVHTETHVTASQRKDLYSLMPLTPGAPSPRWRETRIKNRLSSAVSTGKEVPTALPEGKAKGGVLQWFKGITHSKEKTV
ncbi:hypothetical protein BKA82DRAFT_992282 [Pisolithus tinctorius]|uniref:Uncharacterized protein n=1 Tax=Pisolithus tinctorius Marx 270 TaxID=870435 RepID=A0A0C3KWZ2_PISTI|nr:hypothetical protein BKA82DRAFT_992282 [Pisolithus tinctorius]KIO14057.1 hypothetical protein M404DRAFT_992282 [Pisolithus tinctorius Marx 270]